MPEINGQAPEYPCFEHAVDEISFGILTRMKAARPKALGFRVPHDTFRPGISKVQNPPAEKKKNMSAKMSLELQQPAWNF